MNRGNDGETGDSVRRTTITYAVLPTDTLLMDIYEAVESDGVRQPVLLYAHGGGWSAGSRKNAAQEMFCRHIASQGLKAVAIDWRLGLAEVNRYGVQSIADAVRLGTEDLVTATNYLLSHADSLRVDSTAIILCGGSAGAINVLTLVHDMSMGEPYTHSLPEGFRYAGLISHTGAVCMTSADALQWPSRPCPMLLFHGSDDRIVPLDDGEIWGTRHVGTEAIGRTLTEAQVPHWVFIEHGADHIVAMKELTNHLAETDEFIRDFVLGNATAAVRTDWKLATPEDMATPEHMARFVPYYIYGFGKYIEEMDSLPTAAPEHIVY